MEASRGSGDVVLLSNGCASFFHCLQLLIARPVDASTAAVDGDRGGQGEHVREFQRSHLKALGEAPSSQRQRQRAEPSAAGAACASRRMKEESATRDVGRKISPIVALQRRRREMTCAQVVKCSFCLPADDQRCFHCCSSL